MEPKQTRNDNLTSEQLRRMRTADRTWAKQRDERRAMTVNQAGIDPKVESKAPKGGTGRTR